MFSCRSQPGGAVRLQDHVLITTTGACILAEFELPRLSQAAQTIELGKQPLMLHLWLVMNFVASELLDHLTNQIGPDPLI